MFENIKIPNLDAATEEELVEFESAFHSLSNYAEYKKRAIELRKEGRNKEARYAEKICQQIYTNLPDWAKW